MGGAPLQRCSPSSQEGPALAAEVIMSIPYRGHTSSTTYFITAGTCCKKNILQSERMAELFCLMLFHYSGRRKMPIARLCRDAQSHSFAADGSRRPHIGAGSAVHKRWFFAPGG